APELYVSDREARSTRKITDISAGVQPPVVISPDGKKVAFVSDVHPECSDEECNRRMREELEKNPVKVRVLTGLPFRHWDEWRTNIRHHIFIADIGTGDTRDVTPGDFDAPPHFYEDGTLTFSP